MANCQLLKYTKQYKLLIKYLQIGTLREMQEIV